MSDKDEEIDDAKQNLSAYQSIPARNRAISEYSRNPSRYTINQSTISAKKSGMFMMNLIKLQNLKSKL